MVPRLIAKLFMCGRSQAVRLPKGFRLPGKEVSVRKVGKGILLEPSEEKVEFDVKAWRAKLDASGAKDFLLDGRPEQPRWPED